MTPNIDDLEEDARAVADHDPHLASLMRAAVDVLDTARVSLGFGSAAVEDVRWLLERAKG